METIDELMTALIQDLQHNEMSILERDKKEREYTSYISDLMENKDHPVLLKHLELFEEYLNQQPPRRLEWKGY